MCDAAVQTDIKITNRDEFEKAILNMTIKGGGGTDFRPVFAYVQDRQEQGELRNLQGLLYFTDGDGIYPKMPTGYHTAFLFTEKAVIPTGRRDIFPLR